MRPKRPPPSPDMRVVTLPAWFEDDAAAYIAYFFSGERKIGKTFEFPYEAPPNYVVSSDLERIWLRAAKRYPERPSDGQIELFLIVQGSFPDPEDRWVTAPGADRWRKRMLQIIGQLEKHWLQIPANFTVDVGPPLDWVRAGELHDEFPGLEEITKFINQLGYQKSPHGKQAAGDKAVKRYFMRSLSAQMMATFGFWYRKDVAKITSVVYGGHIEPQHVTQATADLKPINPEDHRRWISEVSNSEHGGNEEQTN